MLKKLDLQKRTNSKIKNCKALTKAEKSEIENLFLDAIDESKKEILRKKTIS